MCPIQVMISSKRRHNHGMQSDLAGTRVAVIKPSSIVICYQLDLSYPPKNSFRHSVCRPVQDLARLWSVVPGLGMGGRGIRESMAPRSLTGSKGQGICGHASERE